MRSTWATKRYNLDVALLLSELVCNVQNRCVEHSWFERYIRKGWKSYLLHSSERLRYTQLGKL